MNRHRRLTLLAAPLLVSSVALAPVFAAPAASAARPAPFCELIPGEDDEDGDVTYDLVLSGFAPRQSVKIEGPRTNFQARVDDLGEFDREDVPYGRYRVGFKENGAKHDKRIGCVTPPKHKPGDGSKGDVKVTSVRVIPLTTQTVVDCTKPMRAEFDGKINVTGTGRVDYHWTHQSSADPLAAGSHDFKPGNVSHSVLHVVEVQPGNNLLIVATLHAQGVSRGQAIQLTCAKP